MRSSYDSLLESDPEFQQRVAEREVAAKQDSVILIVEARFPNLIETAKQKVVQVNKVDKLNILTTMIAGAPNESVARWVLDTLAA